jgi:thiol-disulfide isomerase/thioredoxin
MKKFSLFLVAVMFFCFGIVTPGCSKNASGEAPEVTAGTWINADSFKLSDHKDKIVIVEFWATWCPPCRTSIPHLKTLYNEYKDKGVVLVSLSQEPADTINEFNKKAGMNWIIGAESSAGSAYGVTGIPAAFIVADGKIVWNGHPMDGLDAKVKELVAARGASTAAPAPAKEPVAEPAPATEPAAAAEPTPAAEPAAPVEPAKEEAIVPAGDPDAPVAEPAAEPVASATPAVPVEEKTEGDAPTSVDASDEDPILPVEDKKLEDSEVKLGE